ncbi:unnamed protein product [Leuciscus chuanchicus]
MESTARAAIDARDGRESENGIKGQLGTQWTRQRPGEKEPEPRMGERAASFSRSSGAGREWAPVEMKISHSSGLSRPAARLLPSFAKKTLGGQTPDGSGNLRIPATVFELGNKTLESVRGLKVICDESFADPPEKPALSEGGHTGYPHDKAGEERRRGERSEKTLSDAEDEERVDGVSAMSFFLSYCQAHRRSAGPDESAVDVTEGHMVKPNMCCIRSGGQRRRLSVTLVPVTAGSPEDDEEEEEEEEEEDFRAGTR